ncbi:MAG: choice-of-anchor D domain-containing protein, partial [Planctomycetes bacterium]|nr:choice-of-anchor D domain-containing protein [Planctomycetota bacterium]
MKLATILAASALLAAGGVLGAQDLSDAPSPYPTFTFFQSSQSGYRIDCIGAEVSDDTTHGTGWQQDSGDDGIEFFNMVKGGTATIKVALVTSYNTSDFALWMDFNNDGDWLDAGERVIWAGYSSSAPNGPFAAPQSPPYGGSSTSFNTWTVNIPASAVGTSVKVRAILWDTATAAGPFVANGGGHPGGTGGPGYTEWGEVEDHDIPYGVSTGSKARIYEYDGMAVGNPIAHNGNFNAGNLTAGIQANVYFALTNLASASKGLHFTTAYPNPTVQVSNLVNCQVNMFGMGNGYYMSPGGGYVVMIAMVTPTTAGSAFSFRMTMPCNDPDYPNLSWTCSGNAVAPAPKMEVHRPTYNMIPPGGTDNVGAQPAGNALNLTYTIFNTGSADLTLTGSPMVQLAGPVNCTAQVTSQPPVTTLPGGGWSMTFGVSITPATTGQPFSVNLSIPSNDTARTPYPLTISGTAGSASGAPEIDVLRGTSIASGGTDNVGSQTAGVQSTLSYTVSNAAGTAALNLTGTPPVALSNQSNVTVSVQAQPAASVAAGASTTFTLAFTPGTGAFGFRITIANNDSNENPYIINVSGSGSAVSAPEIDVQRAGTPVASGATDALGTLAAGSAAGFSYTVLNTGNAALTPGSVNVSGQSNCTVTVTAQPAASVAAGASTTFTISVTPAAAGAFAAQLSLASNDPDENPYIINLSGTGQVNAPDIMVARPAGTPVGAAESLGTLPFGTPVALVYTISNPGTQPLNLTGSPAVSVTPGANCGVVVTQPAGTTVAPGSSVNFTLTLTVNAAGAFNFAVSIANNVAGKNPVAWTASGNGGTLPEIDIQRLGISISDGGTLNIGTLPSGTNQNLVFLVFNTGNAPLNLTGTPRVALSGASNINVNVSAMPGPSVAAGGNASFAVSYAIPAPGPFSVTVTVLNDDPDEAGYTFTVTGNGGSAAFGNGGGGGGGCAAGGNNGFLLLLAFLAGAGTLLWRRKGL